jgi:hypothetical protein
VLTAGDEGSQSLYEGLDVDIEFFLGPLSWEAPGEGRWGERERGIEGEESSWMLNAWAYP